MKKLLTALFLMVASVFTANAATINYVYTGTGSGTLNGVPFSNQPFTISAFADTTAVQSCGVTCKTVDHTSASIALNGNTYTFTSATRTFTNGPYIGFSRGPLNGSDLYGFPDAGSYDLTSNFGPVSSSAGEFLLWASQSSPVTTNVGQLVFDLDSAVQGTFKACLGTCEPLAPPAPIPTLSEWVMLMLAGLLGIIGFVALRRT